MASRSPSGIHRSGVVETGRAPQRALPLEKILASFLDDQAVRKGDLELGDTVVVTTRNSTYVLCALGNGQYTVSGGWFSRRTDASRTVGVNGCTWGGSTIKHDIVAAPGLFLEFGNGVKTTRIQDVRLVRAAVGDALQ